MTTIGQSDAFLLTAGSHRLWQERQIFWQRNSFSEQLKLLCWFLSTCIVFNSSDPWCIVTERPSWASMLPCPCKTMQKAQCRHHYTGNRTCPVLWLQCVSKLTKNSYRLISIFTYENKKKQKSSELYMRVQYQSGRFRLLNNKTQTETFQQRPGS